MRTCKNHAWDTPAFLFDSLPYPTRTICRRVRTYVRTLGQSRDNKRKEVDHIPWIWGSVPRALLARGSPANNNNKKKNKNKNKNKNNNR